MKKVCSVAREVLVKKHEKGKSEIAENDGCVEMHVSEMDVSESVYFKSCLSRKIFSVKSLQCTGMGKSLVVFFILILMWLNEFIC